MLQNQRTCLVWILTFLKALLQVHDDWVHGDLLPQKVTADVAVILHFQALRILVYLGV
jgi:hypothetical protein